MSRRRKLWVAAALAAAGAGMAAGVLALLESRWLSGRVRQSVAAAMETATGGRVEIGGFRFDWKQLRAEIADCTIHGTEPAGKPPLFQAQSIAVGLKIGFPWQRAIEMRSIEVARPRVFLMVLADGRTNLPAPKSPSRDAAESILSLAIGRFQVSDGGIQIEAAGRPPGLARFEARGRNLSAHFRYVALGGPRYDGTLSIHPLDLEDMPVDLDLAASLEKGRITLASGKISTGNSAAEISGGVLELAQPGARLRYDAGVSLADVARIFHAPELQGGEARAAGAIEWSGGEHWTAAGDLRAWNVAYRDRTVAIRGGSLAGPFTADPAAIQVRQARISGAYAAARGQAAAEGRIAAITLRPRLLELRGVALETLGGTFRGEATLHDWDRYEIAGEIAGFAGRRLVAMYSAAPLPWDALASGTVRLDGSLGRRNDFRAAADIVLAPAPGSAPVHGRIAAGYEASGGTLDLGHSTLELPSSRAEFSGSPGNLLVHLETRDLNDLLPVLGESAVALPVRLDHGFARFEGAITGPLDRPHFAGHVAAGHFVVEGRDFDSWQADVVASAENVHLRNAVLARGSLRASFDAEVGLQEWRAGEASPIFGKAAIENAPLAGLLALLGWKSVPAAGSLTAAATFSGTIGKPLASADMSLLAGSYDGEPFDRFSGRVTYAGDTITLENGAVAAGARRLALAASFRRAPGRFDVGRLHFQAGGNAMPIEEIVTLKDLRHGLSGAVELQAEGDINLTPAPRLAALRAEISARGLQLAGRPLGDMRLTAASEGQTLRVHLEGGLAASAIQGDATVELEGNYPAKGTVTFTRLELARLRPWIAEGMAESFAGFAEGELRFAGPALRPAAMTEELRLERLEIGPAEKTGVAASLALHNSGPIVAAIAGSAITLEKARLAGHGTDVAISGKINLGSASPLDLRVTGQIDGAAIHEFDADFTASGILTADAAIRGTPAAPQVTGRVQFQKVACNVAGFPNGLANAAGVILFSGDRATIQSFTGETGGGTVQLGGFAGFDGHRLVFQLQAQARQVRIRYPEGVSTVADANLRLTGTSVRSTLAGTITVRRAAFNPQADFSSFISRSAEPVQAPSARTGLLSGINFDVQIDAASDVQFQSALTEDLQAEANLRLRGTPTNPALLGHVNIIQGQVVFYGTKFAIHQGSISFYNALKIEPVFDVDLDTKARGVDITLTVSGPLNHLNLTPRSDPPMQFSEIVALLATGTAPASDPSLLSEQAVIPQGWQQLGASALLGSAIANPLAGRLQRFFGVSNLRIDPTLPGVEINNPQARVTLEQQVTPDITFTYIVNVTNSNPQVVRLEWALNKQWSVVALREENGVFGLDFFYKKRF